MSDLRDLMSLYVGSHNIDVVFAAGLRCISYVMF